MSRMINVGACCRCKCEFWIPEELYQSAKRSAAINFYCPYGHEQHYPQGETEETKLRRERDRLKQELAYKDDKIAYGRKQAIALRGQLTKARNRAKHGVCPCCSRSFTNLKRHMDTKHPEFDPAGGTNIVPFDKASA